MTFSSPHAYEKWRAWAITEVFRTQGATRITPRATHPLNWQTLVEAEKYEKERAGKESKRDRDTT